ncbi:MAG: hypothetical protein IJD04_03865 [Desulfovibrionaceae bacterium]|nr:hypothetical protein [Desulfovibrionaceae bacterium]
MNKARLYLVLFCLMLSGCASGATVGIGGGGGSYGGGGGIGISFPVGSGETDSPSNYGTPLPNYMTSNLSQAYPDPNCYQPMKPDADDSTGSFMVYKQQLDKYRVCIDTYVQKAKNDMQTIEAKANSAMREYRLFVTRP